MTNYAQEAQPMQTVLVANRGEIAVRIIRAVHDSGGKAVAVHPADDAVALHVHRADAAIELPGAGSAAYLDIEEIIAAAMATRCTAIHPGYGYLSENAELARRCTEAGITFVGPSADVLTLFGDKAHAREYALSCGVPVLPGTSEATTLEAASAFAAQHGAVMIKALAGGGGRGMREVTDLSTLPEAFQQAASEAAKAFGGSGVYVEKLLVRPRHIEVQVLGDGTGCVIALGERECSIQRKHQKLVEVAPSPWLDDELRNRITDAAVRMATGVEYAGVGTFEFLLSGEEYWFLEANPRVQVEHTVTEEVAGVDLVAAQLAVAGGSRLAELGLADAPSPRGVAIQVRVNTESLAPDGTVVPSSGPLSRFDLPTGPGVRVGTYGYRGYRTSHRYDSLLAKVVGHGSDIVHASLRVRAALEELAIEGVATNADLLHGIVSAGAFLAGPWDTGFVAEHLDELRTHRRKHAAPHDAVVNEPDSRTADLPADAVAVAATTTGTVARVDVETGDVVRPGQCVAVVEAMKMEHAVRAAEGFTVGMVTVDVGDVIEAGTVLAHGPRADSAGALPPSVAPGDTEDDWSPEVAEVERRRDTALLMGGSVKVARQHGEGKLDARQRIAALADAGSFSEIGSLAGFASGGESGEAEFTPANFIAGTAHVDGRKAVLGVDDFTLRGGAGDAAVHAKQVFAEEYAREMRLPVIRLLDGASGGGSVKMATAAGCSYVPVNPAWDAVVDNLSLVPVVAAAVGPTVGLGAARLVMSHLSLMVEGLAQVFTAGPPVVLAGTGERLTKHELGGTDIHRSNGTVERIVADEQTAFGVIRRFLSYLPTSVFGLPPVVVSQDPRDRCDQALLSAVPRNPRRTYDPCAILDAVFDADSVFPYAQYGSGTLTALARLDGHPVGVIAADPAKGSTMSAEGALAVTRLADLCETFHLPLVSLTDQAGLTIGSAAERAATIRHGARAVTAIYQTRVPQAELIIRRVYGVGGAGIINRHRASRSWSWPSGDWGSLPSRGGVEAAFRAQIAASDDPAAELTRLVREVEVVASPLRTAERFGVQDIIDPRESRPLLCDWVRDAYRLLPEYIGRPSFGARP